MHEGDDVTLFLTAHFHDHNNRLEVMKDGGKHPFLTFYRAYLICCQLFWVW